MFELKRNGFFVLSVSLFLMVCAACGDLNSSSEETDLSDDQQAASTAPSAVADQASTVTGLSVQINVAANDTDDGTLDLSSVSIVSQPANGTIGTVAGGVVTYTPAAGFSGSDSFSYTIADNDGLVSDRASVTVTVSNTVAGNCAEADRLTFYEDADGDSYGDAQVATQACEAPQGYVADDTDCDDTNADIHPGAAEICGDAIDQNCSGADLACPAAGTVTLANFNDPNSSGQTFTGWTFDTDLNGYGSRGWRRDDAIYYANSWGPRIFNKEDPNGDGAQQADIAISTSERSPLRSSGGSLWGHETTHIGSVGIWPWYDGIPFKDSFPGQVTAATNRMSLYVKTTGIDPMTTVYTGDTAPGPNFHIGTYLCWNDGSPAYGTGDGCPYEGPGNQHYYHYAIIEPDAWVHILCNQRPTHRRNSGAVGGGVWENGGPQPTNVVNLEAGVNYFEQLHHMYIENRYTSGPGADLYVDNIELSSTQNTPVPVQNEDSVSTLWVGYWASEGLWKMGWQDTTPGTDPATGYKYGNNTQTTFAVRWSTSPINEANWDDATPIVPEAINGFGGVSHTGNPNYVRRSTAWGSTVYTRFKLPAGTESANNRIYFAVKDVSVAGGNIGTDYPFNRAAGDYRDAIPGITLIDYVLRP